MEIKITGKNIEITRHMEDAIYEKLDFLNKFLTNTDKCKLTVSSRKQKVKITVIVSYRGKIIKIEREVNEFYEGLDIVESKLKNTISRQHSLKVKQVKESENLFKSFDDDEEAIEENSMISVYKQIPKQLMSESDAIEKIEELGHDFFLFSNIDKLGHDCILYRKQTGEYGLIEAI